MPRPKQLYGRGCMHFHVFETAAKSNDHLYSEVRTTGYGFSVAIADNPKDLGEKSDTQALLQISLDCFHGSKQILIYQQGEDEPALAIRLDKNHQIVEIAKSGLNNHLPLIDIDDASKWIEERNKREEEDEKKNETRS